MVDGEPNSFEVDQPLEVDEEIMFTSEVVYIEAHFRSGKDPLRLRVPITEPVDGMNDDYTDYARIVEHVDQSMNLGQEGVLQVPFQAKGEYISTIVYLPIASLDAVFVEPPVMEEPDA